MTNRVVVTGLGVVSPNGIGIPAFLQAVQNGISGIKFIPLYRDLKFNCQLAGVPDFEWENLKNYISDVTFHGLKSKSIGYGLVAALDAWSDSGMAYDTDEPHWETGCVFGNSIADTDAMKNVVILVDRKEAKKLGSRVVEQAMN
ncbi:MAG TPA: beta-ketoacyl synthase N-terminal-like domain-containing protein, partial [Mucilaginibacter sp.]